MIGCPRTPETKTGASLGRACDHNSFSTRLRKLTPKCHPLHALKSWCLLIVLWCHHMTPKPVSLLWENLDITPLRRHIPLYSLTETELSPRAKPDLVKVTTSLHTAHSNTTPWSSQVLLTMTTISRISDARETYSGLISARLHNNIGLEFWGS